MQQTPEDTNEPYLCKVGILTSYSQPPLSIETFVPAVLGFGAAGGQWLNGRPGDPAGGIPRFTRKNTDERLNFYGFSATGGWHLTGESRPYDRVNGRFNRLIPRHNFDFGRGGGWGAFEIAARFSYTDLDDGDVRGGRMGRDGGIELVPAFARAMDVQCRGRPRFRRGHDGNVVIFKHGWEWTSNLD